MTVQCWAMACLISSNSLLGVFFVSMGTKRRGRFVYKQIGVKARTHFRRAFEVRVILAIASTWMAHFVWNTSNSFSYELHNHNKYGWKHIFKTKHQLVE